MSRRVTVYLDEETLLKLKDLVRGTGKPAREVVQDALARYSATHLGPDENATSTRSRRPRA